MKRFLYSMILGLLFPFSCFMAIGIATDYMTPSVLTEIKIFDQPAPGLLLAPFSIPFYLDIYLREKRIAPYFFDTFLFRFSSLIFFNWGLYGCLFYLFFGKLKRFGKSKIVASGNPPLPPTFEIGK